MKTEWTLETLRAYLEAEIAAAIALVQQSRADSDKAIAKAEISVDKRLESMNAFRAVLSDQQSKLLTRIEYETAHSALVDRVDSLEARLDRSEGTGIGRNQLWGYVVAAVAVISTIVIVTNLLLAGK